MPVRRGDDGEIVNEETNPVFDRDQDDPDLPTRNVPDRDSGDETYQVRRGQSGESLFDAERADQPSDSLFGDENRNWDSLTEPIGRRGKPGATGASDEADKGRTRVYRGNRATGRGDPSAAVRGQALGASEGADDPMVDPPVGWLVVVGGPGKGRALVLGSGMNPIGRNADSRVRLDFGDDNVSRRNHARVIYEPRQRRWLLGHGDGTNLTYLNGDLVVGLTEIESGAEIQLGETIMRFQAFCSKEFDWQDVDD